MEEYAYQESSFGKPGEYIQVKIGTVNIGIPVLQVNEFRDLSSFPSIAEVPSMPEYVKGLVNIRGRVIPVIGLREFKGIESYFEERLKLIGMLRRRERDHINWLKELETSVKEKRAAKLERDPTKCKFGKWYTSYTTDHFDVRSHLLKFEDPHKAIHQIADRVKECTEKEDYKSAEKLIHFTQNTTLAKMLNLFKELYEILEHTSREILIIIEGQFGNLGFVVDTICNKYLLSSGDIQEITIKDGKKLIGRTKDSLMDLFNAGGFRIIKAISD